MSAPDTNRSSAITDHPFEPRTYETGLRNGQRLPTNPNLCGYREEMEPPTWPCSLAEAAHTETTVQR